MARYRVLSLKKIQPCVELALADQKIDFSLTFATMAPPRDATNVGTTMDYQTIVASWSPEERATRETVLKRKIDLRLLPILVSNAPLSEHCREADVKSLLLTPE